MDEIADCSQDEQDVSGTMESEVICRDEVQVELAQAQAKVSISFRLSLGFYFLLRRLI